MKQKKDGWCGPASLAYAAKKQDVPVTQEKAAQITHTTVKDGVDPNNLVKGAKHLGLTVHTIKNKPQKETFEKIQRALEKKKSVIVDYLAGKNIKNDGHYSVVEKITNKDIMLWDPETGKKRSLSKKKFTTNWKDTTKSGTLFSRWAMILS